MKILMLDIETAPHMAAVWGLWQQNVAINQIIKPGYTLCWAAKWRGEKKIHFDSIQSGHRKMIRGVHALLEESDAVCHYNGTKFDIPTLNKEFLLLDLKPPSPSAQIDLLRVARSRFRLASNKLDFVAQQLGLGQKTQHKGFDLWLECMAKNPESWRVMEKYNKNDVVLLEKVYDRLLPWIKHHPNRSVHDGMECCPSCGSESYQARGYSLTQGGRYQRLQCTSCGAWYRSKRAEKLPEKRMAIRPTKRS